MKTANALTVQRCKEAIKELENEIVNMPCVSFNSIDFMVSLTTKAHLLVRIEIYNSVLNDLKEN